jgi:hypothetical protein
VNSPERLTVNWHAAKANAGSQDKFRSRRARHREALACWSPGAAVRLARGEIEG